MNSTSLIFALAVAGALTGTAWFIDWGARRGDHWSLRKRRIVNRCLVFFAIVAGALVYHTDATMRGTTLFEVSGSWDEIGDREWTIVVEHPGVEHKLMVYPKVPRGETSNRPIILRCLFGEKGKMPLVLDESVYKVVPKVGRHATGTTWKESFLCFTPTRSGPCQLIITAPDGSPPQIHLRLTDPKKRDGRRAPGY